MNELVDTFEKLQTYIRKGRSQKNQANFQPVMIKELLLKESATKIKISEKLQLFNDASKSVSYYNSAPVFRILLKNNVVDKTGDKIKAKNDVYSLHAKNLTENEKKILIGELDSWINLPVSHLPSFLSFNEAQNKVRELAKQYGLKSLEDWKKFVNSEHMPDNIPKNPWYIYKQKYR
jgi:hypothetical protein